MQEKEMTPVKKPEREIPAETVAKKETTASAIIKTPIKETAKAPMTEKTPEKAEAKMPAKQNAESPAKKEAIQAGKAQAKKAEEKAAVKKKPKEKIALIKVKKPESVKKLRDKIKEKKKMPVFRGRFGCEKIRNKSIKKFNKWRHPRGIDIKRKKEDGRWPRPGFGFNSETRTVHPSGFKEVRVSNAKQLQGIGKTEAARISGTVGWKKRKEIVKEANKLGIHVLNY